MEHDTEGETLSARLRKRAQPAKIARSNRRRSPCRDSDDHAVVALEYHARFAHLAIAEVMRDRTHLRGPHELEDFREREAFEQGAEEAAIGFDPIEGQTARGPSKPASRKQGGEQLL